MSAIAERRPDPTRKEPLSVRVVIAADRGIYRVAGRWLVIANLIALPFAILPIAVALLKSVGATLLARPIDGFFGLFCHQREDRSFHLWGERMACCHRCFGIYGSIFLLGLFYAVARERGATVRPLRLHWAALMSTPLIVDWYLGESGVWESTWYLRVATGALLSLAICWVVLPYLERECGQIRRDLERRFARLVAQGRARPLAGAPLPAALD